MTFEELLAEGEQRLTEERARRAAAWAEAKAQADAKRVAFLQDVREGIEGLLPAAVLPYVRYSVDLLYDWSYEVAIEAPGCAPVGCEYITGQKRFNGDKPFRAPAVEGGFLDDWGEGVAPEYDYSPKRAFFFSDLGMALAVARERYSEMQGRQADFERREAEVEAAVAVKMEAEAVDAAVRGQTQEPSLAEQLAGLIRVIVRQELDAAAGCA